MTIAPEKVRQRLRSGEYKLGVWGTGFIGFSTMAYYGEEGIQCIGFDTDPTRVERINDGETPIYYDMESWLGFETGPLSEAGLLEATSDHEDLLASDVPVHFVAVPTERDGHPWSGALEETIGRIVEHEADTSVPVVVMIESTLTPGMTEEVVLPVVRDSSLELGTDIMIGVAPRRDWFISPDKKLPNLPRVFGGQSPEATAYMESVLDIVCENLVPAPDHEHAELVKSIENAYRHMGITFANQLDSAYPDIDMREVLRMVGTKWNIPTYYPSVGTGGYCVPVASQYVLAGTDREEELSLLKETAKRDREQPTRVADALADHAIDSVTVLGLAYKGDLKVDVLSPTVPIVRRLQEHGVDVTVNDPYYDDDYIEEQTGAESVSFPEGVEGTDAIVIVADHRAYRALPNKRITDTLQDTQLVIDNHRIWEDVEFDDVEYHYTGDKGWLDLRGDRSTPAVPDRD